MLKFLSTYLVARTFRISSKEKVMGDMLQKLTFREREVVGCIVEGLSNQQIAERLIIALQTVKNHVSSILKKTGLKNRADLRAWAKKSQGL